MTGYSNSTIRRFPRITPGETMCLPLVRAVRQRCWALTRQHDLKPSMWRGFMLDLLRDLDVTFVDSFGVPREIDTLMFEATDAQIDADEADASTDKVREWFKHVACHPVQDNGPLFVTEAWREHFRTLGSIVGAAAPEISVGWPRLPSPAVERHGLSQHPRGAAVRRSRCARGHFLPRSVEWRSDGLSRFST